MKLVCKSDRFVVYDEVLPPEQFKLLWLYAQRETFATPMSSGTWLPVWRLLDGQCVGTKTYTEGEQPFNNVLDSLMPLFKKLAEMNPEIIKPYKNLSLRTYIYPTGTKLSWHNDEGYNGAMTYYIHKKWSPSWGGELMTMELPKTYEQPENAPHLDHEYEDELLSTIGLGQVILPKPNRLVLMRQGVMHSINRVDPAAGSAVRCSIVGFFKE